MKHTVILFISGAIILYTCTSTIALKLNDFSLSEFASPTFAHSVLIDAFQREVIDHYKPYLAFNSSIVVAAH